MPREQQIDYLELPAADLERAESFYAGAFGWTFTDYGADYRAFNDGHTDGGFYRADKQSRSAAGAALVVLFAAELEATRARVLAAGGEICKEVFDFPGGRRFHFLDPNGNELAVWSNRT